MAESFTTPYSLPILGTSDLVRSPSGDNLRKQLNAISTATNTALLSLAKYRKISVSTVALATGSMYLQRSGHTVTVTLNGAKPPALGGVIASLPDGYRNEVRFAYGFAGRTGTGLPASFEITEYGDIRQYTTHDSALYGVLTFQTNEEYPA